MTGPDVDIELRRYFQWVGHTLEAVALGDPQARTWAVTLSEYRNDLIDEAETVPPVVRALVEAMDLGRFLAFDEFGEKQMSAES